MNKFDSDPLDNDKDGCVLFEIRGEEAEDGARFHIIILKFLIAEKNNRKGIYFFISCSKYLFHKYSSYKYRLDFL